jgi:molybdopterin-guanine dinucleotide biosynthesis protein A
MLEQLEAAPEIGALILAAPEVAIGTDPREPPRRQVLPLAVRVQPAARAAREAVEAGRRSLQALLDRMAVVELPMTIWRPLDPAARTLLDVDTPADLERIRSG